MEERAVGLAVGKVVGEMEVAARMAMRMGAVRVGAMVAGPMPPKVVMTHGRKRRPRAAEPEACLAVFSAARAVMMAWASRAAAVA